MCGGRWRLAAGWLRLAAGGRWRLTAGGRLRLTAGGRLRLAAGGRLRLAAGGRLRLAAGGRWRVCLILGGFCDRGWCISRVWKEFWEISTICLQQTL